MRRVAGLVLAAGLGAGIATARADAKLAVTAEGGAEVDSNVQRSVPKGDAAPVARLGAKLTGTGRVAGGGYGLTFDAQSQVILSGEQELSPWNLMQLSGDARWMRPIGQRDVSVGFGLLAADKLPIADEVGDHTFRMLGAEGLLALRGGEERSLTLALGGRDFAYKPDHRYDWRGPTASVRLDLTLWERDEGARSLELSARFELEARSYDGFAIASACSEDTQPQEEECYAGTSLRRSDRFQRGELELTWTGRFVAAASYELSVTDSNSYGQSIVRNRIKLSATKNLVWRLYGTVVATLHLDHYPDGLPVDDLVTQSFTTLDDENRSSLRARIACHLSKAWEIESHGVIWRGIGSELDSDYRREQFYVGAIYAR